MPIVAVVTSCALVFGVVAWARIAAAPDWSVPAAATVSDCGSGWYQVTVRGESKGGYAVSTDPDVRKFDGTNGQLTGKAQTFARFNYESDVGSIAVEAGTDRACAAP